MFAAIFLVYSLSWCKLATNIYAHRFPGGGKSCLRMWLNQLTMEVPKVPSGDILIAIDNEEMDNEKEQSSTSALLTLPLT